MHSCSSRTLMWPCDPSPWRMALRPRVSWWSRAQDLLDWVSRSKEELFLTTPTTPFQTFSLLWYRLCKLQGKKRNEEAEETSKGPQESLEAPHSPSQLHCPHLNLGTGKSVRAQSRQSPDDIEKLTVMEENTRLQHFFMHRQRHPTLSRLCRHQRASLWSHCP